jgi:hypothetical protein
MRPNRIRFFVERDPRDFITVGIAVYDRCVATAGGDRGGGGGGSAGRLIRIRIGIVGNGLGLGRTLCGHFKLTESRYNKDLPSRKSVQSFGFFFQVSGCDV